ncbi:Sir2 family NAD-dependent protein deacetylase, partial [Bacillus subtilis]|uniref:Sir2 family NAD-dependent protein deacetylase n=1 Tax=Bacillus subtilis TaxID=1423 RepID=UPI002576DA9D
PTFQPNEPHFLLTQLHKQPNHLHIFTQNIHGLHKKAPTSHVYELHGSIHTPASPASPPPYHLPHLLHRQLPHSTSPPN